MNEQEAYEEICAYTLTKGDPEFIHQHVVDAYTAQRASTQTKPIAVAFALVGLYLAVEKGFTGKQVQRAHMRLARRQRKWPAIPLPPTRGSYGALDVLAEHPGSARNRAIQAWCLSVWEHYHFARDLVVRLLRENEISD